MLLQLIMRELEELLKVQKCMVHMHLEHLGATTLPASEALEELQEMWLHKFLLDYAEYLIFDLEHLKMYKKFQDAQRNEVAQNQGSWLPLAECRGQRILVGGRSRFPSAAGTCILQACLLP